MIFRFRAGRSRRGLMLATVHAAGSAQPALAASKSIEVLIDQAMLLRLERSAAEIIVGNPSIADVAVQTGKVLIVTGKSFGETNVIVLDAEGKVIIDRRRRSGAERRLCDGVPRCQSPDAYLRPELRNPARHPGISPIISSRSPRRSGENKRSARPRPKAKSRTSRRLRSIRRTPFPQISHLPLLRDAQLAQALSDILEDRRN
jgi:hypothetical protein